MNATLKQEALARLAEADTQQPDALARLWDTVLTNLSLDERAIVQATLNALASV